jgi:hypothetical protein
MLRILRQPEANFAIAKFGFIGKGYFYTNNKWIMEDRNFKGELTLNVSFDFVGSTAVVLKGLIPGAEGWQVKYIKVKSIN